MPSAVFLFVSVITTPCLRFANSVLLQAKSTYFPQQINLFSLANQLAFLSKNTTYAKSCHSSNTTSVIFRSSQRFHLSTIDTGFCGFGASRGWLISLIS
jgi:hypothetical protein